MKRLELFEFEDFNWLPVFVRTSVTNLIKLLHKMTGTAEVLSKLIIDIKEKFAFNQIVDLGSGSGGPMPDVVEIINKNRDSDEIKLILSDYYPNPELVEKINSKKLSYLSYLDNSLDAKNLEKAPQGLKTMIASFHHMNPATAKEILLSAQRNEQGIIIYEIAKNNIPVLLWWILLPLSLVILFVMTLFMTPFVKGLSIKQLFFTYIIPIIPIVYAWDGQASIMRTYTFDDIRSLLGKQENKDYIWEIAEAKKSNGKSAGYYVFGCPQ